MTPLSIHIISLLLGSLIFGLYIIPKIAGVVKYKQLMDSPNERSSHTLATPNLGGMAFYIVLMLSFYFSQPFDESNAIMSIIP